MARTEYDDPEAEKQFTENDTKTRLAGDVIALPIVTNPNTGPTPDSGNYAVGKSTDPKIQSIGRPIVLDWMDRMSKKPMSK